MYDGEAHMLIGLIGQRHVAPALHRILERFGRTPGKLVSYDAMILAAWPDSVDEPAKGTQATLKIHVHNLRNIMRQIGTPETIETVWGYGYILHAQEAHLLVLSAAQRDDLLQLIASDRDRDRAERLLRVVAAPITTRAETTTRSE